MLHPQGIPCGEKRMIVQLNGKPLVAIDKAVITWNAGWFSSSFSVPRLSEVGNGWSFGTVACRSSDTRDDAHDAHNAIFKKKKKWDCKPYATVREV